MNDNSDNNWAALSDKALIENIGSFVKAHRIAKNQTQETIANQAGISRSTLSLLEKGETVTLTTLIQVLRSLDLLHVMNAFKINRQISPLALAKLQKKERQRARGPQNNSSNETDW